VCVPCCVCVCVWCVCDVCVCVCVDLWCVYVWGVVCVSCIFRGVLSYLECIYKFCGLREVTTGWGFLRAKWRAMGDPRVCGALVRLWRLYGRLRCGRISVATYVQKTRL